MSVKPDGEIPVENRWDLIQTTTGAQIKRADAEIMMAERWRCPDEGHLGGFLVEGSCRICGQGLIKDTLGIGWQPSAS